ncbi:protein-L-isoaspartate(D-aspartate) O-methyltransferase [Streptomyces sp. NPDC048639]|uniref:protein-L-isoaspartate(D-aspartate) O-methyltransferase n=1 Tax=Streptomyces sp. NPDC048639 TaxID=3365581 RepID=UPI00371BAD77
MAGSGRRRKNSGPSPPSSASSPEDLVRAALAAGVRDRRVLEALRTTPRTRFVPAAHAAAAYIDAPLPIGRGQVTSQPSLSALMIEGLELTGTEHVLEIGTGHGFQTALLARVAGDVVSIDRWPELVEEARRNLLGEGIGTVELLVGDGTLGVPEHAPYDAVLISAAFLKVPPPVTARLRPGGRLVAPIGPGGREDVVSFVRTDAGLAREGILTGASFVRLYGRHGYPP